MLPLPGSRIEALLRDLEASPTLDAEALVAALAAPIEFSDVVPWVRFDAETYRRNLVARTARWEVRLMCWRPGQATSLHPHGDSACAFRIIRGSATETRLGDRDRVWTQGEVVREPDGSVVHQVANREVDALISLHVYSPPLPVDAPSPAHGHEIVVVGGGFAGAAAVTHLLSRGDRSLRITWVEHGPWLGRGIAYGVESPVHKLNVPASRMSIDPAKPNDFVDFRTVSASSGKFSLDVDNERVTVSATAKGITCSTSISRTEQLYLVLFIGQEVLDFPSSVEFTISQVSCSGRNSCTDQFNCGSIE